MADKLTLAAISAFVFVGIIGLLAMTNPPANTIPPTPAYSRITNAGANFDAENYDSQISLGVNHFNTTRMANGVYLDLARNPYAQISDSTTQSCPLTAANVSLNTNDSIYKVTHSTTSNTHQITVQENGIYQVIAVPQVGEAVAQGVGIHNFWMMKNGAPVPNSNIKTTIFLQVGGTETFTASLNWVGKLESGDVVSFQQSCTDADIGIIANLAGTPPATPSIIISIAKISP